MSRTSGGKRPEGRGRVQELQTERKYVTILRVDLHGSTNLVAELELEESIGRLAPAMAAMRASVHAYGGIVHREMGDGLFAVFGAPLAHDLHAVMGCLAALDLLKRIEALGDADIRVRIGVHSGQVVAGPRRLDFSTTYEFDGPPLIVADRLQSVAQPGQALASAACRELAAGYVHFGPPMAHELKGFPQPVTVHAIEGVGELSRWRISIGRGVATFVGREAEIAQLLRLENTVKSTGTGRCVALVGEPGVGKSRLAHEHVGALAGRGWQVIEAECSPIHGSTPYALLKALLADAVKPLAASAIAELRATLPETQAAALEIVLHGAGTTPSPAWNGLTPQARGRAIVGAARAVTQRRIGEQPCLLLIEDLQWADEASVAAVEAILALSERLPLFVLVTARSGSLPDWFERYAPTMLAVESLRESAGLALLDHILGPSPSLGSLKQRILQHTGAMPLFIEEVCRGLAEAGILTGEWGAFTLAAKTAELGVPMTLQGVIASRIDRLRPPEKRLLQVAAAIGPKVPDRLLLAVAGLLPTALRQSVGALLASAMLVASPGAAEARGESHLFPHELIRQVAYDAVPGSEKAALHGRILAALEATRTDGETDLDLAGALAHHAFLALEWSRAAEYSLAIARRCFAQAALPDAMKHYETAMQAVDRLASSPEREARAIDLRLEARQAYANIGKVTRWLDLAKEAEARAEATGDSLRRVAALAVRAAALNFCGTPSEALHTGEQAIAEAARCDNPGWLAYAEYGLGQACYVAGRYGQAVEVFARAHRRFALEGATPPMGGSGTQAGLLCCMMSCLCQIALGDDAGADAMQRLADETVARDARPLASIAAGLSRGALLVHQGDLQAGEAVLADALALARRHEVNLFVPVIACQHGLALLLLRRPDDARQVLALARAEADALGHRSAGLRAEIYDSMCRASDRAGREATLARIRAARQAARQQGYEPLELEAALVEATLLRARGDAAEAERSDREADAIAARLQAAGTLHSVRRAVDGYLRGVQ